MDSNSRFLLKLFRRYYKDNAPVMPDRFTKREFGFFYFDRNMVQRHLGFRNQEDLRAFMIAQVPSHSYYSTAYYRYPTRPVMEEKEWLGAELIFDLDADHLEGAESMSYDEMLVCIRNEMINLVDSFLYSDLGFSEDQVYLTFSGGRGYHAHVKMPDILTLGTHERRELVDYITCTGLDIDWVFPYGRVATSRFKTDGGSRTNVSRDRLVPPADSGGWRLRMRNGLKETCEDLAVMDVKQIKTAFPAIKGSQNSTVQKASDEIKKFKDTVFEKNTMATLSKSTQDILVKIMKENVAPRMSGEVDKPVTPDIKRIIRLPGSVHGKTGLRVTPINREILTNFNPLEDAVPDTYSDESVNITMRRDYEFSMKGEHFSLKGETEVPEYAAAFLIGRKVADFGHLSEKKESLF